MVYTRADVTFLLGNYLWPRGYFNGSGRKKKHHVFQPKILYKVIITKDRVNGVCGIACTFIQETEKVSNFFVSRTIRAFVRSKTNLPKSGRLRTCYSIRYRLIPQKQVFEFWGMSVSFKALPVDNEMYLLRIFTMFTAVFYEKITTSDLS